MFERGTMETSVGILFDGLQADDGQKLAVCESLKSQGVIKPSYQLGSRLPCVIQINALAITQRNAMLQANQLLERLPTRGVYDTLYDLACLWFGDPNSRFPKFVFISGVALIAARWWQPVVQQLAVKYFGLPSSSLADFDHTMFWSGWGLVGVGLCLYVWGKSKPGSKSEKDSA
jgi:hypothetical protein